MGGAPAGLVRPKPETLLSFYKAALISLVLAPYSAEISAYLDSAAKIVLSQVKNADIVSPL